MYIGSSVVVQTVTALYVTSLFHRLHDCHGEKISTTRQFESFFCHLFFHCCCCSSLPSVHSQILASQHHSKCHFKSIFCFWHFISSAAQAAADSPNSLLDISHSIPFSVVRRLDCFRTSRNEFSVSELSKTSKPSMHLLCHSCSSIHHHCTSKFSSHQLSSSRKSLPSTTLSLGRVDLAFDDSPSLIHEIKYWWNHTIKHTKLLCCCRVAMMMFDDDDGDGMYV